MKQATNKPKMGRPPLPPAERMDKQVKIRFTAAEREELERAADGNTAAWAREVLLRAAKRR
jgi:hypothetical protein